MSRGKRGDGAPKFAVITAFSWDVWIWEAPDRSCGGGETCMEGLVVY